MPADAPDSALFPAYFTSGGTMGNRVGIHTALAQFPTAFVYYSSATHHSVKTACRDMAAHFREIPADDVGRMVAGELVAQALKDQAADKEAPVILFLNLGTTFAGGCDDVAGLRQALFDCGIRVSYTHVDGALDLGFKPDPVALGVASKLVHDIDGRPVVQGITLSHFVHGVMQSGEVVVHTVPFPDHDPQAAIAAARASSVRPPAVGPRIVMETWLFQQLYGEANLRELHTYCVGNSERLRAGLAAAGIHARYYHGGDSLITMIERAGVPPWVAARAHLAPERDMVHYITMPHITAGAVDAFVAELVRVDAVFTGEGGLEDFLLGDRFWDSVSGGVKDLRLRRLRPHHEPLFDAVVGLHEVAEPGLGLPEFKRRYVFSAMSFVVVQADEPDVPLAVFLVRASAEEAPSAGPVLVRRGGDKVGAELAEMQQRALMFLRDRLGLMGRNGSNGPGTNGSNGPGTDGIVD
ncbi:pyridoxal phosphate-dependent transferase [Lasiosphaeria miniovina]|uniref:Pyridoxal phosphate-dependent transferase n=1 Tax=Lasiosphaeria miniovina TaxID=1954250 RepID=A0AA40ABJ3_9PEZI|nr:pyridoxal phosphate-dependent transferase [Lasiosphaeria miniovina]KAK0712764.1 pyridoxal phosphate-dependent transferase [Lasiosphaeria miniovina]